MKVNVLCFATKLTLLGSALEIKVLNNWFAAQNSLPTCFLHSLAWIRIVPFHGHDFYSLTSWHGFLFSMSPKFRNPQACLMYPSGFMWVLSW